MPDQLMKPEEVAVRLQVHEKTIHRWIKEGKLPGIKIGRFWRVEPQALEAFLEEHKTGAQ